MKKIIIPICLVLFLCSTGKAQVRNPEDCDESCGSLRIPYPFGIQEGCYLNSDFRISCNQSEGSNPPIPLYGTLPVESISEVNAEIRVRVPYSRRCYEQDGRLDTNLSQSMRMWTNDNFPFSQHKNSFTVVGCDTYAWIRDGDRRTGCMSICPTNESMIVDGDGTGYCQTSIPRRSTNLNITIDSFNNHSEVLSFNPCGFAFLAANDFYNFTHDDLRSQTVRGSDTIPIVIDWSVGDQMCEQAQMNRSTYICGRNSYCTSNITIGHGYNCHCSPGYEGNPYLQNGCQDIDECSVNSHNDCANNSRCENTPVGNYTCYCEDGFEGDGRVQCNPIISNKSNSLSIYLSIGIVGAAIVVLIVSTIIYLIWKRRKYMKLKEKFFERNGGIKLQQTFEQKGISSNMLKIFTAEELHVATNNYDSNLIAGKGGYGTVYKGTLPDGSLVAIKKSNQTDASIDQKQVKQFISEIAILCQVNNRNIVHLRGCCFETPTPILVYEFVSNGTLSEHLHKRSSSMGILSMETRLRIASQTARVLSYLHSEADFPIIHRDIKSTNILLDENFNAKVSDFGASRLVASGEMQVCTMVQGTLGYLDPEYMQTGELTDKSDVYSFGVMLVELITGRKAVSFDKPETERNLAKYFLCALKENRLTQVLDQRVIKEGTDELLRKVADVAKRCLSLFGEERPSMKQVAMELEGIIDFGLERSYSSPWVGQQIHSEKENVYLLDDGSEHYSSRTGSTSYDTIRNQELIAFSAEGR